ncbi:3-hydroxyacyl-CoA dehydrogenase NAD-binding domain-containing protein [Legionella sp. CNM-4043-24]|uniref:3-hydroxyacyl-CoA dehydrogenase NAD-binding domain-containing protein n=1 Tax=Legionella sp. CNM-4043-24 TaxID=3421646 RepID=UPI00403ADF10
MSEPFHIKKVAVLGAGVMGAQIAAHCVNAGIETLLYDMAGKAGANALVDKAIVNLTKLKPSPLATTKTATFLQAKNYDDNLADLHDCDLVIEAIAERLDWKESLYQRIAPHLNKRAILVSNTSGLSINSLASVLPESLHSRFCGVHFFNPPRYMHLAELIPAKATSKDLLNHLETWLTSNLGKGVVVAKDTPNFIANRIGVFSLLMTIHHAEAFNLGLDEVDALTGSLLNRPKSATFRTMDVVGLDTMEHVVQTMQDQLPKDPWHAWFKLPVWLGKLISEGHLGQKTGQGIYRKPGKVIEVLDYATGEYRASSPAVSAEVQSIMAEKDIGQRVSRLLASTDRQAQFLAACFRDLFHYCAFHLEDIAANVRDVDLAMRWGFGWQQGPFETWQAFGVDRMLVEIRKHESVAGLPGWLNDNTQFYTREGAYAPASKSYMPGSNLPVYRRQISPSKTVLVENKGISLTHLEDDIAVLSFKSKANTIGQEVLDGLQMAMDAAEKSCRGVIIYQNNPDNFSSGADLRSVMGLIQDKNMAGVDAMITAFQNTVMRIKYSPIPVVAALRGRALGGGCELLLHCDAAVAAFESYPGLVEVGVGLIPAGGGCKEMALRAAHHAGQADLMTFIQPLFEQIATAAVSASAPDAVLRHYLRPTDTWVMNSDEVLYVALSKIKYLLDANYSAPLRHSFKAAGREGHARLLAGLSNWLAGGFISQHDYDIASKIGHVICGGDVNQGTMVDEAWLLKLEREAFVALAETPLTQARIAHLLETGKPLRN